ncbi:hypothetical protein ACRAWD_19100 [Caulobacter segnis]
MEPAVQGADPGRLRGGEVDPAAAYAQAGCHKGLDRAARQDFAWACVRARPRRAGAEIIGVSANDDAIKSGPDGFEGRDPAALRRSQPGCRRRRDRPEASR